MGALTDSYNKWRGQQGENSAAGSNTSTEDEEKKVTVIGKVKETEEDSGPKNVGGFGGGLEYLGTKFVDGLVSNVEGIVDFVAGGIAQWKGDDEKAQEIFQNDWYNYNRADEKYNPGTGMKVAGDLTGVLGGAVPDIGAGLVLAAAGAPTALAMLLGAGLSFTSGSGRGINEAVNKTGELGNKEWAGGMGSGALAAGIELISGGIGAATGGMFGKATTEIGMEIGESLSKKASSKAIGGALGEISKEGSEATAKNIIKKIFTSKSGKELAGEMISEGIEESIETFLEPAIKQNTYDPDAPNASVSDVGYSFLLGAAGGGLIKGGQLGINSAVNTVRGGKISADSTKMNNLMHNAQAVSSYESEKQTGSEVFKAVTNLYNEVQQKLQASGGKPTKGTMEKIGELDRMVTTAVLVPSMVNAAKGIAQNAQSTVDALNNFYKKTGQDSITVERLTAGLVMDKGGKAFVRSVEKAMSTNGLLRSVVINNMLGRMEFDAQSFANSIYGDIDISSIATQQNLNRFLSIADAATINQLGAALGISNWAAVTPEDLAARIKAFRDSGQAELHRGGYEAIEKAKRAKGYTNGMPENLSSLRQGATRFKTDKADFAIIREGDKFRLYDFETGHVTNAMSLADMEAIVARLKQRAAEIDAESEMAALDRELNDFANENVPEYKKLTEAEKEAVRATLRSARANGISVKDQILFARIAAKSGLNIIVKPNLKGNNPARYDGKNTVYINASAPKTRLYSGLLGHEVFHKMFRSSKIKRLFMQAWNNIDEGKRQSVINRYMSELKKYDTTLGERIDIANEEVAAAYAEEIFNNPGVWDYILSEEPSLKDRVIAFFKGAPKRYSFAPEMDAAAKKWIQEYKKLFDQVAARNAGMNVVENVTTVERKEEIKKIGKLVDELGGTATQVPKKVIKKIGKLVPDENAESNKKTASGTKVQDSGERDAIAVLDNGNTYVVATRKVITGNTKAEQRAQITEFFKKLLNGNKSLDIETIEGDVLTITKNQTAKKARDDYKTVKGMPIPMSDDEFRVKLNAEAHIDELAEISKVKPQKAPDSKNHSFAKDGFTYRTAYFEDFDGKYYRITLSIGNNGTVATVYNVGEIKENVPSSAKIIAVMSSKALDETFSNDSISQKSQNSNTSDKNSSKDFDSGERFALAEEDFYASGEEFASPTISTVGKDRVNYEEKFGSKEWRKTKSESAYIHAVDEMYGIQSYLEKVGKRKNAKATIQTVRSTPHMVQTMVGSVQYNIFHSYSKTARKMGDGLNVIWKPIKKLGAKAEIDFNDYLLHYLNVDKYGVMKRVKKGDQDAAESLRQVRKEIDSLEAQRSSQEERIFKLGNGPKDMLIKKSIKGRIEEIDKKLVQARADEIALIGEAPSYAEAELKRVRNEIASLLSEKERAKAEIFTLGNDESSVNRKTELKDRMAEIDKKIKRLSESAAAMEEIAKSYKLAIKPVFSLDGETIGKKQSEAIIKKYEEQYPEFKAVAEKIWKFSKNLNEMRVSAGLMSQSMAARLATMYPHYVPSFKAKINNAAKGDDGIAVSSTVKKAKGYNSNIMDVKESLATQVSQVIRNGNINMLATKVYDTAVKTGDAKYVDIKLPDVEGADLSTEGIERPKPHTIKFFKDGKPFEMNVSDEIYQGFKGISEQSAPRTNVFARATNKISNLYKKLVTSLSPAFMIRNAIRDIQDAGLNSKHPALFAKNIPRAWSELIKNSKNWQTYRAYGGFSSTVFDSKGISNEVGERGFDVLGISERIASGKGLSIKDAKYIKSLLTGVENLNAVVEQIPRFAEYLSSIEAGETIEQAVYNSAEVTTNFARRGATTKAFNSTIIPFLNPAIQGFDKIFRNFTDATKAGSGKEVVKALSTLLCKAIMIGIVPMMFNSIMYSDDEDYEDLREEDKENNYLIKLPNGTFIKLPRGRVASVIGGLYNRAARTVTGKDADWKGYLSNVVSQVTPAENLTRTVFSPFVDVATNRTWYGTEIEGAQFENVRPGDRYDESTSSIAIAIGQAINFSPKKIHYLIDQYSGVIGDFLLPATTKKAEKDFFSGNFTIDPVTSNKLSNKFYEIYDEAQYTRTDGDIKAQYQVKYLNRAKSAISEMYKQINEIQNSNISNFEKLQQVRVIRVLINEVIKNAVADYEEINKAIDKTANMGFDDSKASDVAVRYAYIVKEVYGAEKALSEYNDDVYSKMTVLNTADISYDVLFDYYFGVKNLTSDVDEKGNTISGSKREKVVAAINSLDISDEEKLLLIATHGYGLKDGDVGGMNKTRADRVLFNYIASLGLTEEEMLKLYEYAGYDVENGKASGSIASGGSSSGSSSRPTLGGSRSGSRGLGGNGRLEGLGGSTRLGSRATLGSTTRNRVKRLGKLV